MKGNGPKMCGKKVLIVGSESTIDPDGHCLSPQEPKMVPTSRFCPVLGLPRLTFVMVVRAKLETMSGLVTFPSQLYLRNDGRVVLCSL